MRRILGIIFGAIAAFAAIMVVEWVDSAFFTVRDLDTADPAALAALIDSIPLPAKLLVVSGWLLGAFCGAWLALRISDWRAAGWIVARAGIYGDAHGAFGDNAADRRMARAAAAS